MTTRISKLARTLVHVASAVALCVALAGLLKDRALAGPQPELEHRSVIRIPQGGNYPVHQSIKVGVEKSVVIELPREAREVHVSNPKKLDAVMQTGRRAYLIGVGVGQANVFFFDIDGKQIATLEVVVERDLAAVSDVLKRLMPDSKIILEAVNDNIILSGRVQTPADASRAAEIVSKLVPSDDDSKKVVNMLAVNAKEQVLLKVTVAEMQRTAIKQLGFDVSNLAQTGAATVTSGNFTFNVVRNMAFPINNKDEISRVIGGIGARNDSGTKDIATFVRFLEQNNLVRTLAEPTLTAISGETASFLAGGEFPIPIAQEDNRISVEFKPFGVGLSFTPIVLSEGRISMKVSTEVSELDNEAAINLSTISIPGLKVRRANTTIELPSGGALVIAGLISDDTRQAMTGTPGLKNLPVLGALFRSRDYLKRETELVVLVTPFIVDPVERSKLARPDDNFAPAGEFKNTFFGHINRKYGKQPQHAPVGGYKGDVGFIVE